MTKRQKVKRIQEILDREFPDPAIPLDHVDPYTLLVSVVLSAQCTDVRVNQVTPQLFAAAATPAEMVDLPPAAIEAIVKPCGLAPTKARNIWALSRRLLDEHRGIVPNTLEALEALPGVGHKSAQVVLAQAFGQAAFPVDTHIHRLAARWGLSSGKNVEQTERDLKRLFRKRDWAKLHLQMIYFGRKFCPARGHRPAECPICSWAGANGAGAGVGLE